MHNEGYCVPQSLQQNAGSCSAEGLWNQCGGNDLCFVRGPEEESLEKWYVPPYALACLWLKKC